MPPADGGTFNQLAALIDEVVMYQCAHHYNAHTQEHQFSSRLAEAIEIELRHFPIAGRELKVVTRDFTTAAAAPWKSAPAPTFTFRWYRNGKRAVSKGLLVQSKWDHALEVSSERRRLRDQCERMLARTEEAYVWVYQERGIAVVPARTVSSSTREIPLPRPRRSVGALVADGLRRTAGDPAIGRDVDEPVVPALDAMLERLSANTAIEFVVEPGG